MGMESQVNEQPSEQALLDALASRDVEYYIPCFSVVEVPVFSFGGSRWTRNN